MRFWKPGNRHYILGAMYLGMGFKLALLSVLMHEGRELAGVAAVMGALSLGLGTIIWRSREGVRLAENTPTSENPTV